MTIVRLAQSPKMRRIKCKVCKEHYQKLRMGQVVCSQQCARQLAEQMRTKLAQEHYKARKEAIKTRSDWIKETQAVFNAYRREFCKVHGYLCISCGRELDYSGNKVDAGHYRSVGSAPHLRFTELNVWAQCKQCNRYGGGRAVDYRIGLIKRVGVEDVEVLEADQEPRKWTIPELKVIHAVYKWKLKELKGSGNHG